MIDDIDVVDIVIWAGCGVKKSDVPNQNIHTVALSKLPEFSSGRNNRILAFQRLHAAYRQIYGGLQREVFLGQSYISTKQTITTNRCT